MGWAGAQGADRTQPLQAVAMRIGARAQRPGVRLARQMRRVAPKLLAHSGELVINGTRTWDPATLEQA